MQVARLTKFSCFQSWLVFLWVGGEKWVLSEVLLKRSCWNKWSINATNGRCSVSVVLLRFNSLSEPLWPVFAEHHGIEVAGEECQWSVPGVGMRPGRRGSVAGEECASSRRDFGVCRLTGAGDEPGPDCAWLFRLDGLHTGSWLVYVLRELEQAGWWGIRNVGGGESSHCYEMTKIDGSKPG